MNRLDISIGPVQGFVAQSRRTRDLWGSSYLLSVLSGYAMHGAEQAGGTIVSPIVKDDPLYKWIVGDGAQAPRVGSIPNRFVIHTEKPAANVADAAIRELKSQWRCLCDLVWRRFVRKVQYEGKDTKSIWRRQTRNFWEILWTVVDDPVSGGLLACRKHWR